MGLMPPPIDMSGIKDQLQQQAAAASPWQNMAYLMGQTPYTSRFGPTGTGFSMGGPGSEYYFNQWNRYNMTPEQLMYGLGTGAIAGQSQGAHDWFSVEDPTAWQNILGQQGGFDWTQATADPTQIGDYLYNQTQLLGGGMTPQLWSLYNSPQIASSGGNPQGYGEGGAVTMGSWQDNPLYQNQAIQQFYQNMGWDMPTSEQTDPRYQNMPTADRSATQAPGPTAQQVGASMAGQYSQPGMADAYANMYASSQAKQQEVNARRQAEQQAAAAQTVPTTQAAAQTGTQVPTSATGPDQNGDYQYSTMTPTNNPYGTPNSMAMTAQGAGGDSFMPGEDTWPGGDWYPGMPGSDPEDPYGGWGWDPWQWFPPDWPGSSGGSQPPPASGGGQTPGTGTSGQNWGNFNPVDEMYYPQTGFGPPLNFGDWTPWGGEGSHTFGPAVGNMNYNLVQGMNQMLPQWMNPYPEMNQAYGSFFTDYAQQYPGMFSDYLGGLQNLVAQGPYAQAQDPNSALHQNFSYMAPGAVGMAGLENARMAAGMPTTAQGTNAGLYQMLQQLASGQYNPATEGGGQYQDMMSSIMGGAGGQPGLQDWFNSITANGIPNQVLMEDAGNESINQYRNVGDILSNASPYLQSMFEYGPPGQSMDIADRAGLEGLQGQMTNMGRSATTEQQNRLLQMLAGGGLTPEYVSAMQSQVLEPAQKALSGKLNKMAGGKANLGTSGTSEWYNEQLAKDFTDQLTQTGFQNYNNALQQMGQLGQFATGAAPGISSAIVGNAQLPLQSLNNLLGTTGQNARGDYMTIPQSVNPIMQTMLQGALGFGGLGQQGGTSNAQLQQQLLGLGGQQSMGWDQQMQNALMNMYGTAGSGFGQNLQGMGLFGQMMNQPFYGGQAYLGGQQNLGMTGVGEMNSLLKTLLSGQTQENIANKGQGNFWDLIAAYLQNMPNG